MLKFPNENNFTQTALNKLDNLFCVNKLDLQRGLYSDVAIIEPKVLV